MNAGLFYKSSIRSTSPKPNRTSSAAPKALVCAEEATTICRLDFLASSSTQKGEAVKPQPATIFSTGPMAASSCRRMDTTLSLIPSITARAN